MHLQLNRDKLICAHTLPYGMLYGWALPLGRRWRAPRGRAPEAPARGARPVQAPVPCAYRKYKAPFTRPLFTCAHPVPPRTPPVSPWPPGATPWRAPQGTDRTEAG